MASPLCQTRRNTAGQRATCAVRMARLNARCDEILDTIGRCEKINHATRDPMLWVATVRVVPIVDMLLGADWLGARRAWLLFATKQVFVVAGQNG
jgi:hypothetical protein